MRRKIFAFAAVMTAAILFPAVLASAQDLHKTYNLGKGSRISIENISGDIVVGSYNGNAVAVDAVRVGRDRDQITIEEVNTGDRLELRVRYPESCNCDAGVNFEVRVPASTNYDFDHLASVSGDIQVSGVLGQVHAESVSGDVAVKDVSGLVNASSVSGDVDAEIRRIEGVGDMKFSSVSGDVHVRAPNDADATVEMSSLSGSLDTNFPIEIQEKQAGPGRSARGTLGTGSSTLRLSTVSGDVSFNRI